MSDKPLMQSMEFHSSPVRGLLLAMALAILVIFVLPIIVLKALRAAPPQAPVAMVDAAPPSMIKQDSGRLPRPQAPPPELLQYPLP
jgi:hypothetical protein